MLPRSRHALSVLFAGTFLLFAGCQANRVPISGNDIGGIVSGPSGPEAGVWVIAETSDLPTHFRKIVVTDDQGQFVVPDLPKGTYQVWVRGYGLVDSKPVSARPGKHLSLEAVPAPTPQAAAKIYPANYWLSLLKIPPKSEFEGPGLKEVSTHGMAEQGPNAEVIFHGGVHSQAAYINIIKAGCEGHHQVGDWPSRQLEPQLGKFDSTEAAWDRRVKSGQSGAVMSATMDQFGRDRGLQMFASWYDRISAGEVPQAPPRPQGVERNVVITQWTWGGPTDWTHDLISTDKRNPSVNAGGPVYGIGIGSGSFYVVDPKTNAVSDIPIAVRDDPSTMKFSEGGGGPMLEPSPYWGSERVWKHVAAAPHNPMFDQKGRLWVTSAVRAEDNEPAFCKEGSKNPYAKMLPLNKSSRQVAYMDPATKKFTFVDTCFSTQHLEFAHDADNTIYFSGSSGLVGWVDTKVFDETGDAEKAQGWCPAYIDVNKNGKYDPKVDKLIEGSSYGVTVNPADGSVWYSITYGVPVPGKIVRIDRGSNPPYTCRTEIYEPPFENPKAPNELGFTPRGIDADTNGVIWTALSASGQSGAFDRRKCKVTAGSGQQCPEGWTLYQVPGPVFEGTNGISSDFMYYDWVDQTDVLGLGKNTPIATGSGSDSLMALDPSTGKWIVMRVPYPMGFYARGMDGRVDDPNAGWNGRGLWATYGTIPTWHVEGGKGAQPMAVHFQLRPSPLAD